ncbi:hypothetical protein Smp_148520 [Schistosoma mansoni]|nr:hypothetical protein Smp_148520 [Schistosoma mansoni]|eukprot:XP_018650070.1 hypothetical protein Smp_148520 [Schistosoma mansoni]
MSKPIDCRNPDWAIYPVFIDNHKITNILLFFSP